VCWCKLRTTSDDQEDDNPGYPPIQLPPLTRCCCLAVLVGLSSAVHAQEAVEPLPSPGDESVLRDEHEGEDDPETWVDATHRTIEGSLDATILAIDRFFATEQYLADTTDSFVRLRPEIELDSDDKLDTDFKVNAKLDLPGTKRRLRLLVESDPNALNQDAGVNVDDGSGGDGSVALERESKRRPEQWRVRPAVGIKSSMPPDPFVRLRATRYYQPGEAWLARLQGTARYLLDDKAELRAELDLNRGLAPDWLFRARSDLRWRDSRDRTDAGQSFTFAQRLSPKRNVAYSLGVFADDDEGWGLTGYRYLIVHRHLIYRDWLFFEIRPEVSLRNEEDGWEPGANLQLRLEAFFGSGRLKKIRDKL
jgi:hypothetical protein